MEACFIGEEDDTEAESEEAAATEVLDRMGLEVPIAYPLPVLVLTLFFLSAGNGDGESTSAVIAAEMPMAFSSTRAAVTSGRKISGSPTPTSAARGIFSARTGVNSFGRARTVDEAMVLSALRACGRSDDGCDKREDEAFLSLAAEYFASTDRLLRAGDFFTVFRILLLGDVEGRTAAGNGEVGLLLL